MEHKARAIRAKQVKTIAVAAALCLALLCTGCAAAKETSEFFAMDTVMTVTAYGGNAKAAVTAARNEISRLDRLLSIGDEESEISILNNSGFAHLSYDTEYLLNAAKGFCDSTGGLFDVTVYPVVSAWGFYGGDYRIPQERELEELLKLVGSDMLEVGAGTAELLKSGMAVDLGGIAKGYASELAAEAVRNAGVSSAILSLGGNVYAVGSKPGGGAWGVAVQDPNDLAGNIGVLALTDEAAVTSGAYQRYFEKDGETYHHIIDPTTGKPSASDLKSVTVVSQNATLADAYSTALFIMGEDAALEFWRTSDGFELVLVAEDGGIVVTDGLRGSFTSQYGFEVAER